MRGKQLHRFSCVLKALVFIVILTVIVFSYTDLSFLALDDDPSYILTDSDIDVETGAGQDLLEDSERYGPVTSWMEETTTLTPSSPSSSRQPPKQRTFAEKWQKLNELSKIIQQQLKNLQNPDQENCQGLTTLKCGINFEDCGFGCHIHAKIKCLMLSYAMGVPWIHDDKTAWNYEDSWDKYFQLIGSKCPVNENTIHWNWMNDTVYKDPGYELKDGLPVPYSLAIEVAKNHDFPFLWMVGQLAKNVFRLKPETLEKIEEFKRDLGIVKGEPLVGIHVRRTDKIAFHESKFVPDSKFIEALQNYRNRSGIHGKLKVFVASETEATLQEFRNKFESDELTFVGEEEQTGHWMSQRRDQLFNVIRDVHILTQCDFVVCTLSSNIGRLVLEIKSQQQLNFRDGVKSLDVDYFYQSSQRMMPLKLVLTGKEFSGT